MQVNPNSEASPYVPQKIQALATKLILDENLDECLGTIRGMYPNLTSRRSALCKLKAAVIAANIRHKDFASTMEQWKDVIREYVVKENASPESLKRVKDFQNFQACPVKRQLHVQKKIQLGKGTDFFNFPADLEFVAALQIVPQYVRDIHLDDDETRIVQEQQAQKLQQLSSSVLRIENADDIVAFARTTLKHSNVVVHPCELATALAIATGRRMVEIFQKGQFCEIPGQRYELRFTGQAKAGLQEVASITKNKPLEYCIPVLAPAGNIVRGIAKLRGVCKSTTMDAKRINSNYCGKLNTFVKTKIHPELGFHDLRTFYALCSFEAFKPHTYSINGWICKNLGHSGLNMSTSYTRMQVYGINKLRRHNREAAEDF